MKPKRKQTHRRSGESRLFYVPCSNPDGTAEKHRVRVMADGRIALLDHPRGEPRAALQCFKLAGERPCGCYRVLTEGCWVDDDTWLQHRVMFVEARQGLHALRAALRAGAVHVRRVPSRQRAGAWALAASAETANCVAEKGLLTHLLFPRGTVLRRDAGLVCARVRGLGTVYLDAELPGVRGLIDEGTDPLQPEMLALLRFARRLLLGWRGVLADGASAGAAPGPPRGEPCRPSP